MSQTNEVKVWEGTVLVVPNRHYECCGKPPDLKAKGCYTAYFENHYGEQLVFQYDHKTKKGTLWHGDLGWGMPVSVMGGGTTMIMSEEEREWLQLVWKVATRGESGEFQLRSLLDLVSAQKAIYDELLVRSDFAKDSSTQRSFSKMKRKLEKMERSLLEDLEGIEGVKEAERIIDNKRKSEGE